MTSKTFLLFPAALLAFASASRAADIHGGHENPNAEFGKGANLRLDGDARLGWRTGTWSGDIDLNGHTLELDTGGGNLFVLQGAITGRGAVAWHGGGVPQVARSIIGGEKPNTFQGPLTVVRGVLDLDKPAGVDAVPGDLVIGGKGNAIVKLDKPDQIDDAANVTLAGLGGSGLDLQGHNEKFASLTLKSDSTIAMGQTPASLVVGDSSLRPWDLAKTLTIDGFKPGKDRLVFGSNDKGLSRQQLARIGFAAPAGLPEGLYTAAIGRDGRLSPAVAVKAIGPPFDVSAAAVARRAALYEVPGRARLTGKDSPLADGMTIDFFGDSITWQNGFVSAIDKAIKLGAGTRGKHVKLVNRGINGGGVQQIRDGVTGAAYPGNHPQDSFAHLLASDKVDLAVVYIGINDATWRKTSLDDFEKGLRDLAAAAKARKTRLVFATLTVRGELPDGKNSDDPTIEQFAQRTRRVAHETGATLVDMRRAYIAYLQNRNAKLRVDGTLHSEPFGILTYDSVHPAPLGVNLLADLISDGIAQALSSRN